MCLADFDYSITYVSGEQNSTADALSCMPDAPPDAHLAACAMAHTRNTPAHTRCTTATGVLSITTDQSLLNAIVTGYETDEFAKQLTKDIKMGSIDGATLNDKLLYVGGCLVIL